MISPGVDRIMEKRFTGFEEMSSVFKKPAPRGQIHVPINSTVEKEPFFQLLNEQNIFLNPAQRAAVTTTDGPLLLISGAGSGKTTVLTSRIGYMVHTQRIEPKKILLVTFTKKASIDMIKRLAEIPGLTSNDVQQVVTGTYHSICHRILKGEGFNFQLLSSEKKKEWMIKSILRKMGVHEEYSPESVLSTISSWKNHGLRWNEVETTDRILKEIRTIYRQYEEEKQMGNLYDFDDLLLYTYKLFLSDPSVLLKYQKRFEYVLCDEFQDSSYIQVPLLQMLAAPHNNIAVCGDSNQTIYSFRSASPRFMLNFLEMYPTGKKIVMDVNYRSSSSIVGVGNHLIAHNSLRFKTELKVTKGKESSEVMFSRPLNAEEEARFIVKEINAKRAKGHSLREMAIIYRTHFNSRAIYEELLSQGIPFVTQQKRQSFYEGSIVKPIVNVLRALYSYTDDKTIIEAAPLLYVSKIDMQNAMGHIKSFYDDSAASQELFLRSLNHIASAKSGFSKTMLQRKIDCLKHFKNKSTVEVMKLIRSSTGLGYEQQLELNNRKMFSIQKEFVREALDELEQSVTRFQTVKQFLEFLDKVIEHEKRMEHFRNNRNADAVQLLTIHASKGLEFRTVFSIGWSEGTLPHACSMPTGGVEIADINLTSAEALEEERRLAYVSATRAIQNLYISSPKYKNSREVDVSRFVNEMMNVSKNKRTGSTK